MGDSDALLLVAIEAGNCDLIADALREIGGPSSRTESGVTCLYLAVSSEFGASGSLLRVECLLTLGAKVSDEQSRNGLGTSVHRATLNGYQATLVALLGCDGRVALDLFDDLGRTPLICAVQEANIDLARILLDAGSSVDLRDESICGDTALIHAVRRGDVDMVELLLSFGASPYARGSMQLNAFDQIKEDDGYVWSRIRDRLADANATRLPLS